MYNAQACKLNKRIYKNNLLPSVDSIIDYYKNRPELTEYTLNKEIHRIKNYTIYTHDEKFKKITDLSEILTYYTENFKDNDNDDLLWRCANQSLMADIVTSLTTMGFIRPEMGAGMSMEELTLELDFRNNGGGIVRGECFLNVTMLPIQRPLIGIILEVYLCPSRKIFQAQIRKIIPYDALTEEEMNQVTTSLSSNHGKMSGSSSSSSIALSEINDKRNMLGISLQSLQSSLKCVPSALPEIPNISVIPRCLWQGNDDQFVIKLCVVRENADAPQQLRRIRHSRIKVNRKASFPALVDVTVKYVFQEKNVHEDYCDLHFTYHDIDNDCITIASSEELIDAIEQSKNTGSEFLRITSNIKNPHSSDERDVISVEKEDGRIGIVDDERTEEETFAPTVESKDEEEVKIQEISEETESVFSNIDQSKDLEDIHPDENNQNSSPENGEIVMEEHDDASQDSWEDIVKDHEMISHATRKLGSVLSESDLLQYSEKYSENMSSSSSMKNSNSNSSSSSTNSGGSLSKSISSVLSSVPTIISLTKSDISSTVLV